MTPEQAQSILYQAALEPIGLVLRTSDPIRARQLLYRTRAKIGDPSLARLQFRSWTGDGDLVICKGAEAPSLKQKEIENASQVTNPAHLPAR